MNLEQKITPPNSKLKEPPKRKFAVKIKGKVVLFDNIEQYFAMKKAKERTTDLYKKFAGNKNYQIEKPKYST